MSTAITVSVQQMAVGAAVAAVAGVIWYARSKQMRNKRAEWLRTISFNGKWEKMAQIDPSQLLVITDFDATITAGHSEQCHDLVAVSEVLPKAFRDEFSPLLDWTTNANIDGVEWWDRAHEIMLKHGVPRRPQLQRLVQGASMPPRPGAFELLQKLADMQVPVLIVSAGLSDVIEEFLRQHDINTENITVCSNRLNYGADSVPQSVSPPQPITSFTKASAYRMAGAFFRHHMQRRYVLCLGDSVTDIDAAQEVPYDEILSVGFMNSRPPTAMTKYADTFDAVVLGNNGSLAPLGELVSMIEQNGRARQAEREQKAKRVKLSASYANLLATLSSQQLESMKGEQ